MKILEKIQQEPLIFLTRKMWRFSRGSRKKIFAFFALFIFATLITFLEPLLFAQFLNEIQNNGITQENVHVLIFWILVILVSGISFWAFHAPARVIQKDNAFLMRLNYRKYLLEGVLNLNLAWHSDRDSGDTIDKINNSVLGLFRFSREIISEFIVIFIRIIGTAIILFMFNVYIGAAALIFTVIILGILFQFDKRLVPRYKGLNLFNNRITANIFDTLSNITTVIILSVRRPLLKNFAKIQKEPQPLFKGTMRLLEVKWFTGDTLFYLLTFVPIIFYILYVSANNLAVQVGTITAMYMYLARLDDAFFTFAGSYEDAMRYKAQVENAETLEGYFTDLKSRKKKLPVWKGLQIQNLNFSYDPAPDGAGQETQKESNHLDDVNVDITKGQRVAFIGESGSGKTTFLKVIHGLYPTASATLAGAKGQGARIATSFADLDLQTMLVPQEPEIFSSTIRENITLGINYKDEEIEKVMRLAEFTEVVRKLPKDLESVINEKGVNLSGGQKQRLALARALLFARDKEMILLDESTSSVDPENEVRIYQNIFKHFKGKTILASIHKMNLLKYFDRIVIFANGKIVDSGTFEELLAQNAEFKRSWEEYTKTHHV